MYTISNNNVFNTYYNGPHEMKSTSLMGFTVTVRNILSAKKETIEIENEQLLDANTTAQDTEPRN